MRAVLTLLAIGGAALALPASAQLGLPPLGLPPVSLPPLEVPSGMLGDTVGAVSSTIQQTASNLLRLKDQRIARLVRRNRDTIELDAQGAPARRGELLLLDPTFEVLGAVQTAGLKLSAREDLGSLGLSVVRVTLPRGMSLAAGEALLHQVAPTAEVAADNLHFQSGANALPVLAIASAAATPIKAPVGIIDGAPGAEVTVATVRGFAQGAPFASNHGSAVASLLAGAGATNLRVADIYGTDPAGGNALALVRALDWLIGAGTRVVSVSLSGPSNAVVAKAVAAAQRNGALIIAAVGNDGPAAPPSFPASYPGVVAVTAVDGRNRPLIEAGRALHLDYAAPGADILALNASGKWVKVRGTSYAVPLVAARAAAAMQAGNTWRAALDREAEDLGPRGADVLFGRGLLCRTCARGP